MTDLLSLVRQHTTLDRVASTNGGEYAGPCPFCGGEDRFRCWPDHPDGGGQWWCRQCGRGGDLIAYRVERGDITPREAGLLRHDDGDAPHRARRGRRPQKQRETRPTPVREAADAPSVAWREQAAAFAAYCERKLWNNDNEGLEHLRGRGLTDETIRRWRLGWHEKARRRPAGKWGLDGKPIYLARGVVIPWTVDGEVYHVKMRLFETWKGNTPKYIRLRGGRPTLYGLDHLEGMPVVVICEGELDAVLLHQAAGDLVDAVAIGTKAAKAEPKGLVHLLGASRWLLALDADADAEAEVWRDYSGRVQRIRPLQGNDLTDFHQAGGDLRAWVEYHLGTDARLDAAGAKQDERVTEHDALVEAERLLKGGLRNPDDRRRYAEIGDRLGWPCWGATWQEWASDSPKRTGSSDL